MTIIGIAVADERDRTVGDVLERRVERLREASPELPLDQARAAIARDHWFADWEAALAAADAVVDRDFEAAADAIPAGDVTTLRELLRARPELTRMRSPFAHRAMLVHHVAANGIEAARQWRSPPNATQVLRALLDHRAQPDALCETYGGGSAQTPLCLLVSSVHPAEAGVQAALVEELCRAGARPDGLDDDGLPLWTAIMFGYTAAVDALARAGARVDDVIFAAALGDVAALEASFGASGTLTATRRPQLDPRHTLEYAVIYAAAHGRRDAVALLLDHSPDLSVTEPVFGGTALGAARYQGHAETVALLLSRGGGGPR
ncbi:MAG TPA: ankyrin repeat domain-containing protein [Solirubrobacter sp.]